MIFLFSEIDHPALFKELGNPEADHNLASQLFLIEEILHAQGVHWMKRTDKGVLSVFEGSDPAKAAMVLQQDFQGRLWGKFDKAQIRIVLHAGEADLFGQSYVGPDLNHGLKLLDAAHGGQILLTVPAIHFVALPPGARLTDLGSHFLKDLSEPRNIYALQHPDLAPESHLPLRSLQIYPQNFSPQGSPFFGRMEEIKEIAELLTQPSTRLVTLIGPGGFGKTRLAFQAAAEVVEKFRDGVYVVPLAPLLSDQLIVGSIANAIKFFFYGAEESKTQLLNHLRDKEILLIMDNFEHIIEGAQLVREMLVAAPGLKILATSREGLKIDGEKIFEVRGLRYPESTLSKEMEASSAVQLFLKSARRVHPDFSLKPGERESLLKICRLLEGMPLGLELSATWVTTLSPAEIGDKIESSWDFLATSMPHLPPRHRSLRAVFEYSWILLSEAQKEALKIISVFKGGFSAQAAQEVAGATGPILSYLENKSLVRKRYDGRFEIHELLKYYAREKLFDDPHGKEKAMDAHSLYFSQLLKKKEKDLFGSAQRRVLDELVKDIGNIQEGWKRAVEKLMEREMGDYLRGLWCLHSTQGWLQQALEMFRNAVQALRVKYPHPLKMPPQSQTLLARTLSYWAVFENDLGKVETAKKLFEESLAHFKGASALSQSGFAWSGLGYVTEIQGDYKKARSYYEKGLQAYHRVKDHEGVVFALNNLGHIAIEMNDFRRAQRLIRQSLQYSQHDRDRRETADSYNLLGDALFELGRLGEAKDYYQKGLQEYLETEERKGIAWSFKNLGKVAQVMGDYSGARQMFREGLVMAQEMGIQRSIAWSKSLIGTVCWAMGEYKEALILYEDSLSRYRELGDLRGEAWTLDLMGNLKLALNEDVEAERLYRQAYSLVVKEGTNRQNIAWNFYHLGAISLFRGRDKEARERFLKALQHFERLGDNLGQAATLTHLGEEAHRHQAFSKAEQYLKRAVRLALKSKAWPLLADVVAEVACLLKAQGEERKAISFLMVALTHPACRQQTKDRMVSLTTDLESKFSAQEVQGGLRWAKAAKIEDVAEGWMSSLAPRRKTGTLSKKSKKKKRGPSR